MEFTYNRIAASESHEELDLPFSGKPQTGTLGKPSPYFRFKALRLVKDALLTILALWGLFHLSYTVFKIMKQETPRSCDCGSSTVEAVKMGCKYDSLAAAWLPEHCRDDELTAEFERSGDGPNGTWIYYADTHHTKPLGLEEIAMMADDPDARFHMSAQWHKIHCIFYWKKEHRFRFSMKMVEPRSDSEEHIHHCGQIFMGKGYGTISGVVLNTDNE